MSDEAHRHACEVAYWWAQTGGDPKKIKSLLLRLEQDGKRSAASIAKLRQGLLEMHNERKRNG